MQQVNAALSPRQMDQFDINPVAKKNHSFTNNPVPDVTSTTEEKKKSCQVKIKIKFKQQQVF
jgi:hypothetical protein